MAENTKISWCDHTFNIAWGCWKISPGCANCFADAWDGRFGGSHWGQDVARKTMSGKYWQGPLKWNKTAESEGRRYRVFCSSMTDVFLDDPTINTERVKLWPLIRETPWLDWQLLTKRPENIAAFLPEDWGDGWSNVWMGVSVENQEYADIRLPILCEIPAAIRWVSYEPALGPVDFTPWLGGCHGTKQIERNLGVSSRAGRRIGDRSRGEDLEDSIQEGRPMEPRSNKALPLPAASCGEPYEAGRLPAPPSHVGQDELQRDGASSRMAPLLWPYTQWVDSEPQMGKQAGQQAGSPGINDPLGTKLPHEAGPQESSARRREEQSSQDPRRGDSGYTGETSGGRFVEINRGGLRSFRSDHLEDRPGSTPSISWVVVGGESGNGARPFDVEWARSTVQQCRNAGVTPFVKQLGHVPITRNPATESRLGEHAPRGRIFPDHYGVCLIADAKGGNWDEWPDGLTDIKVREFPNVNTAV